MDRFRTDDLLLHCLRTAPDEAGDGALDTLSPFDWEGLIEASARYGVAPLLYHRLRTRCLGTPVPASVVARLRHLYLHSAGRNVRLYHEFGKALRLLRHARIPVIVLKGAYLAERVYGNIALRPMGDLDILVHKDDLVRVEESLLGIGYAPAECHRKAAESNCEFVYGLPHEGLSVEVHWNFLPSVYRFTIDTDELWERSRQAVIAGVEVSVLCPEDLLLHLCLHTSAKHLFAMGLKSLCDIVETIRHCGKAIDWKKLHSLSEQWGETHCVYLTFRLARELLGAAVPDDLMNAITPGDFDERFMVLAQKRIFAYEQWMSDGLSLSPNVAGLWGSTGLLDKGALFLRRACPRREEVARMYPAPEDSMQIYFYYLVRMKDLLLRHGRQMWRLMRGDEELQAVARRENDLAPLKDWLMSP